MAVVADSRPLHDDDDGAANAGDAIDGDAKVDEVDGQ